MNLLVLQLKRIGDLILTTPALAALRQQFPQGRITLCLSEASAGLAPALPFVDEVQVVRRKASNAGLWKQLATSRFDACLDFTGNDRSAFFALLSKAPRRITYGWVRKSAFRAFFFNEFVESNVRERHTIAHHLDLLSPLGVAAPQTPITLRLPAEAGERAACLLAEAGIGPACRFAVIHPGTARTEKYWVPERWAAVIDHCQGELGLPCVVTGGDAEFEQAHLLQIQAAVRTPWRNLSGTLDLLTLAALIQRAALLMSMDSAPVHLGAAFQTPQISLFGVTNPFHWRPLHARSVVLLAGSTGPLTHFEPRVTAHSLSELSTEAVIGAISPLFSSLHPDDLSHL
ncbi:MAG: glycosyltransferase family 9 protein [Verrucomicrobiota bacterium]